jgi:ubiquinone/menaquinone biosynthesis C-methylase UbiE
MANPFSGQPEHSADFFNDARDHWWHRDFLALAGRRWRLDEARAVLDVGSGVGHWSREIARLAPEARLEGIEREPRWVEEATARAAAAGLSSRTHYRVGTAEALPFEDGTFDVVTCQTVLIHVRDPGAVLAEMVRVTRPGGLVIAAEPTNLTAPLVDAVALGQSAETAGALVAFLFACQRGKKALGLGDDALGEALPGLFAKAGLRDVEVRVNDRPSVLVPPYASDAQRATVEEDVEAAERERAIWDLATTRRYWLAQGGDEARFDELWALALDQRRRVAAALRAGTFTRAGGALFYLVSGRRAEGPPASP